MKQKHNILDVANWMISQKNKENKNRPWRRLSHAEIQSLCYLANGWSLAIIDKPLFSEKYIAAACGPRNSRLQLIYDKPLQLMPKTTYSHHFSKKEITVLETVWASYSGCCEMSLRGMLTDNDSPWALARGNNLQPLDSCQNVIWDEDIKKYYRYLLFAVYPYQNSRNSPKANKRRIRAQEKSKIK